ncbi:tyrosine-type recombinase/integrase [Vibrio alfacsensis]|uniref:tyrosine-type recombinase/integrase n=1 Tax=Vibrio alfacsensis TaxID=1074311 RepID=UPI00406886B8
MDKPHLVNVDSEQSLNSLERYRVKGELTLSLGLQNQNPAISYLQSLPSRKSRRTVASCLNSSVKYFGGTNLERWTWHELNNVHLRFIIDTLLELKRAPRTINLYLAALKGVANEAFAMKLISSDTLALIKMVKSVKGYQIPKGRALDDQEIQLLFQHLDKGQDVTSIRDAAIISLMLGAGLRRSEVVALDLSNVTYRDMSLLVKGKGNKQRQVYLPEQSWKRLVLWIEQVRGPESGSLFYRIRRHGDVTQSRLTDQAIYYILQRRRELAMLHDTFAPHDLRRTFASGMLDCGEDLGTLKDALGHASITTTQQYDHRHLGRLREARVRLDSRFKL